MQKDFSDVSTSLKLLPALVHALDGELGQMLFRPDDLDYALLLEPLWALSWAVTLFAHNVDDRASLVVLWDRLLAAPPCFPLYVGAALVVHHRESLIATATEDDAAPFLHGALSKLPGLTSGPAWDSIATSARRLLATTPPARAVARAPRRLRPYLAPVRDVVRTPFAPGRAAPDGPVLLSARQRRRRPPRRRADAMDGARRRATTSLLLLLCRRDDARRRRAALFGGRRPRRHSREFVTENALLDCGLFPRGPDDSWRGRSCRTRGVALSNVARARVTSSATRATRNLEKPAAGRCRRARAGGAPARTGRASRRMWAPRTGASRPRRRPSSTSAAT